MPRRRWPHTRSGARPGAGRDGARAETGQDLDLGGPVDIVLVFPAHLDHVQLVVQLRFEKLDVDAHVGSEFHVVEYRGAERSGAGADELEEGRGQSPGRSKGA